MELGYGSLCSWFLTIKDKIEREKLRRVEMTDKKRVEMTDKKRVEDENRKSKEEQGNIQRQLEISRRKE